MPKGIYDRAASNWTPPPRAIYSDEIVAAVREAYESGMSMRETAETVGVTVKVLQRLMPRHGIERRVAAKRNQSGEANHMWCGDTAGYQALHLRVEAARGKPCRCERCGLTDPAARYEWANLTGNYTDTTDFERMCVSCHRRFDAARRQRTGARTSPVRR